MQLPVPVVAWLLPLLLATGCAVSTSRVVEPGGGEGEDPERLALRAEEIFRERPRTVSSAREAFRAMSAATRSAPEGHPRRYEYLAGSARIAAWLANHVEGDDASEAFADTALVYANTAVQADSSRVEGFYWRAVGAGVLARHNRLTLGRSAMTRIRDDASTAIRLDSTFQHGGPHRVLGGLYLRAPGPPAGVGSLRRALHHLELADEIAPGHPENILLLAEAYLEAEREEEAARILNELLSGDIPYGDSRDRDAWRAEARSLLERIRAPG